MGASRDIWKKHWKTHKKLDEGDPQIQVARTTKGKAIDEKSWIETTKSIIRTINLNQTHVVLDLCCGNGLLSKGLAPKCKNLISVDYSKKLLDNFVANSKNITVINSDVLEIEFDANTFDVIIIYFAIQHFTEKETIELIGKCQRWLKVNGVLFIGDIPDLQKKWQFYGNKKYRQNYIYSIVHDEPIFGTFFDKEYFLAVGNYYNFHETRIIKQKPYMINHKIRYDVLYIK